MKRLKSKYKYNFEAGCDEAGRGCLAGPVVAGAVILPPKFFHKDLNDSKVLSHKKREELRLIIENEALAYAVGIVDHIEIDQINILNASIQAMHLAVSKLKKKPEFLLIDGNRFHSYKGIEHQCIVKGDSKFLNIAAASILAKTYRDDIMLELHQKFPNYFWDQNKGYPTIKHRQAIQLHGVTPYHRKSFKLLKED